MTNVRVSEIVVDGIRSLVRSSGATDSKEAVVFVHGNPGSSEDFAALLPHVGTLTRAIAVDMPGYGKADRPREFDYTVEGYARHLGLVLDALGVESIHLVLHDFGGPWGMHWASLHPTRVKSLSLFNMGVMPEYRWHKYARIWRIPVLGELLQLSASRRLFRALLNAENPRPFPREFVDRMYDDNDWGMKRAVLKLYRATSDLGPRSARVGEILRAHSIPTLVMWGENDSFLSVKYAARQKEYLGAEVHTLPRCGHWPMIDEPERVRELLMEFLTRQVPHQMAATG